MPPTQSSRPLMLVLGGGLLAATAIMVGFGPSGPVQSSMTITPTCWDLEFVTEGECGTTDCSSGGCVFWYKDCNANIRHPVPGDTWATLSNGPSYTRTCKQCDAQPFPGGCGDGGNCSGATEFTFTRPVGATACNTLCCP